MPPSPSGAATVGTEEPSLELRLIEGTKVCRDCKREQVLSRFIKRVDHRRGLTYYYPSCRDCTNAYRKQLRATRLKPAYERYTKILPPYPDLRKMYVDQGMTITEIAQRYKVSRTSVWRKLEFWAKRLGDEWPLPVGDRKQRMSRAMARRSVRSDFIIEMVYAWVAEHPIFMVDATGECEARPQTVAEFARRNGFVYGNLTKMKSCKPRISKAQAVALLRAIGEDPHPDLLEENYRLDPKYSGNYYHQGRGQMINSLGGKVLREATG